MVAQPGKPIPFLIECLVKVEIEGPDGFNRNMFIPGIQADGSRILEDGSRLLADG